MAVAITIAGEADAEALADMLAALAQELGGRDRFHSTAATLARHFSGPRPFFHAVIARDGGTPAGFALFFPHFSTWRGQPGAYVQDLWVSPPGRGTGLGERLLAASARHAAEDWRAAYLMLSVDAANSGARRFYERLGFRLQADDRPMALDGTAFARLRCVEALA
ncbi:GNAT family N-acetyltransferase [Solirhodobacter olei]|uniref:GNAT family N-acetyltransferase n=1 Tax=Solirhodobacter olei TaxID=2493082 RepID=UPI000FDBCB39|nr:GNAT family N-acetyltransferase [Solirhodobacter olei]